MAKEDTQFKNGHPGGPGRPRLPEDLKEVKKLNQFELEKSLNEMLTMTPEQLKRVKTDPESTMLQILIASIITHGANKGDPIRLNFLLDRLIGKMKENIHVKVEPFQDKSDEELALMAPDMLKALKEKDE